jgi:hypothetical protein
MRAAIRSSSSLFSAFEAASCTLNAATMSLLLLLLVPAAPAAAERMLRTEKASRKGGWDTTYKGEKTGVRYLAQR